MGSRRPAVAAGAVIALAVAGVATGRVTTAVAATAAAEPGTGTTTSPSGGAGAGPSSAPAASARLQGFFSMSGRVTDAVNVAGEHRGERVQRVWAFASSCPAGACPTVTLARQRRHRATDNLILQRRAPGFYVGHSSFDAPVLCGGRRHARGERVPFRLTVRVIAARVVAGQVLATQVQATYSNTARTGLTPCVSAPAHDAVRYAGALYLPPGAANRSDASTASTPRS